MKMKTAKETLDDKIDMMLQEAILRYCTSYGRNGQVWPLTKAISKGFIQYLTPKIKELIYETKNT